MAENLLEMKINPGDPVTSDLLANIIANINKINTPTSSSVVALNGQTVDGAKNVKSEYVTGGTVPYSANTKTYKNKTIPITGFTTAPTVSLTVRIKNAADQLTKKYQPVIVDVSPTAITFCCISHGATSNGTIQVDWIAVGN